MTGFTEEELKEIIRVAQIFAPAFNEEQYRKLIAMTDQIAASGFIEAAYGVYRLEQQYGLACSEAPGK